MNRLLLDSHILLWWANKDPALDARTVETIRRARDSFVSAATLWELSIKIAKGRLQEERSLAGLAEEFRFRLLPVTPEHATAIVTLPRHHGDPFDHMLLAQAKVEGLTLVTHDEILSRYGVPVLLV